MSEEDYMIIATLTTSLGIWDVVGNNEGALDGISEDKLGGDDDTANEGSPVAGEGLTEIEGSTEIDGKDDGERLGEIDFDGLSDGEALG